MVIAQEEYRNRSRRKKPPLYRNTKNVCVCVCVCVCKYCARGIAEIYVISRGSTHVSGESINSVRAAFTLSRDASSCSAASRTYIIQYIIRIRRGPAPKIRNTYIYFPSSNLYISVHNIRHLYIYIYILYYISLRARSNENQSGRISSARASV